MISDKVERKIAADSAALERNYERDEDCER